MFDVKLDTSGFDEMMGGLRKMFDRPTDFMLRPVEEWFAETEREQFDTEGGAGRSGRWKPLTRSTVGQKERQGFGGAKILQRTGATANVLTRASSLRQFIEVTDDKIIFRLPSPAGFHQSGTRRMPQRKVVDPSDAQLRRLSDAVRREVLPLVRDLGFGAG